MTHRVQRKYIYRIEDGEMVKYDVGDEFEATDQEIELLSDRLEPVEPSDESADVDDLPFDPRELKISDLREFDGEYDQETLGQLHELESAGKDRQTAHDLMERRVTEG